MLITVSLKLVCHSKQQGDQYWVQLEDSQKTLMYITYDIVQLLQSSIVTNALCGKNMKTASDSNWTKFIGRPFYLCVAMEL